MQLTDGEVRSVKCKNLPIGNRFISFNAIFFFLVKSTERKIGTGRVGHARSDNVQKFTVDTFDPENQGEKHPQEQERSPQDKPRNRNPRRNQKPREFQHPTLENIIITKANVQDRLLKIAKDKDVELKTGGDDAANDN